MIEENNFGELKEYSIEHKEIIRLAKELRSKKKNQQTDWQSAAEWHIKYSFLNGHKSLALTITLSPVGCQWARKGGCTMCGEFEGADRRPKILRNAQFHIAQFASAISNPEIWETAKKENCDITWLRIFQEGNYTNKKEMNVSAQETILRMATRIKGIKRITIEARPQYITEESVSMLRNIFKDIDVELEVGMGVEAVNDVVRNICINKGDSKDDFIRAVNLLNKNNIKPLAYILVKPPFLTEKEAIFEAVSTAQFATKIGFKRISFEPMSIHAYSLVDALFQCGLYKVPWLWSVIEIAKRCSETGVVDFGIGGIGFYPLPTTFAHNYCKGKSIEDECNDDVVKAIIQFNKTHDINCFATLQPCNNCYKEWQKECESSNHKSLKQRINEQLNQIGIFIKNYAPQRNNKCDDEIKIKTLIASGFQLGTLKREKYFEWLNSEFCDSDLSGLGFTQSVAVSPHVILSDSIQKNNTIIRNFQLSCLKLLKIALKNNDKEILNYLINDTPQCMGIEYLKNLPEVFWKPPVFFRTDESSLGRVFEIQCPGSSWGELELLYNFYNKINFKLNINQPAQEFTNQLVRYLGLNDDTSPLVYYLIDNASIPVGVRYFISQTRMTNPPIKYWGIDKYPLIELISEDGKIVKKQLKAIDSDFVRTHYYLELFGECDFNKRIYIDKPEKCYDLPPMSLFDQKAILALPFWEKTKKYFDDDIRSLLVYTTPLIDDKIRLESGETLTISDFADLPQSRRKYYLKYAGTDGSINWGSRAVTSIEKIGKDKLTKLLHEKVIDYQINHRIWILQAESKGEKKNVTYYNEFGEQIEKENLNTKYSYFYGPYGALGGIISYRKNNLVHGQPDTIIRLIDLVFGTKKI